VLAVVATVATMMATAVLVMFVVSVMLVIVPTRRTVVAFIVPIATICVADAVLNILFR
jgi:hypothetical protein